MEKDLGKYIIDCKLEKQLAKVLSTMKTRCYNHKCAAYCNYGAKGINICDEWLGHDGLKNFCKWAIDNGFNGVKDKNGYNIQTIDRVDNKKGYSPQNCKWSTRLEQANNKNTSIFVEYNGRTDTLSTFCRELNLDYHAVFLRIYRRHWAINDALSTPIMKDYEVEYDGDTYTITKLARKLNIRPQTLKYQFITKNKPINEAIYHCLYQKGVKDAKNI